MAIDIYVCKYIYSHTFFSAQDALPVRRDCIYILYMYVYVHIYTHI